MSVSCKWGLKPHLHEIHFWAGTPKCTRAVNLGHGLRHLHDKDKVDLFQG